MYPPPFLYFNLSERWATRISGGTPVENAPNYVYEITGFHPGKFTLDIEYNNVDGSYNNVIAFRFAEVLLNYAEAKAELVP